MAARKHRPVILYAFANDPQGSLRLGYEQNSIEEVFQDVEDNWKIKLVSLGYVTLDILYDNLARYNDRILLFHFAGHSSSESLDFIGGKGDPSGIASVLGQQKELKLVFLNGCANQDQVELLIQAGVKCIVATSEAIDDNIAVRFSGRFYKSLAAGLTLQESFDAAESFVSNHFDKEIGLQRGLDISKNSEQFPWVLHPTDGTVLNWSFNKYGNPGFFDFLLPRSNRLKKHKGLRRLVGYVGMFFYILAVLGFVLWNGPAFSWANGSTFVVPLFVIGITGLLMWYDSRPKRSLQVLKGQELVFYRIFGVLASFSLFVFVISFALQYIPGLSWLEGIWMPNLFVASLSLIWRRVLVWDIKQ